MQFKGAFLRRGDVVSPVPEFCPLHLLALVVEHSTTQCDRKGSSPSLGSPAGICALRTMGPKGIHVLSQDKDATRALNNDTMICIEYMLGGRCYVST